MNKPTTSFHSLVQSDEFQSWCDVAFSEVLENLFYVNPTSQKVQLDTYAQFDVSGVVAFIADDIEAVLQLSCTHSTVFNISGHLQHDADYDEKNVLCIGEAVSIIFGMLKEKLNTYNLYYEKCLPIVVYGNNHIILNLNTLSAMETVYKTPYGLFSLKVGFNQKKILPKAS